MAHLQQQRVRHSGEEGGAEGEAADDVLHAVFEELRDTELRAHQGGRRQQIEEVVDQPGSGAELRRYKIEERGGIHQC